jgi:quinol monooxygenase YgiN
MDSARVGLYVRLQAKPGQEAALQQFLCDGLSLAEDEPASTAWFAIRMAPATFGIFDVFPNEESRKAHLSGPIATALMAKADELLAEPPCIEQVDVLAAKLP